MEWNAKTISRAECAGLIEAAHFDGAAKVSLEDFPR